MTTDTKRLRGLFADLNKMNLSYDQIVRLGPDQASDIRLECVLAIGSILEALPALLDEIEKECRWNTIDEYKRHWLLIETSCGRRHRTNRTPTAFCPNCGGKVKVQEKGDEA